MNPLGTRARAEELSRLLDGSSPIAAGGSLASYRHVADLLRTAGAALGPATAPRAEFRESLRTRLVAVATVQAHNAAAVPAETVGSRAADARSRALEAAVSWSTSRRTQRGMGVAAGAMASVVAVAGIAVAGSQSIPGDPFYGVKKGTESLELRFAGSDVDKGSKHLEFASERLSEVRALSLGRDAAIGPVAVGTASALGGSVGERVRKTLAEMDEQTRKGSALLTNAYRDSKQETPLEILASFAGKQTADLRKLLPKLPSSARPAGEESLALVSGVAVQTSQLLALGVCTGDCSPAPAPPEIPPASGLPQPQPAPTATTDAPCACEPVTEPSPTSAPSPEPSSEPSPEPEPAPSPSPSPSPSSPAPSPSPSNPLPLPVPLPTLPVPLPTLSPLPTLLPLPDVPVAELLTEPAAGSGSVLPG